MVNIPRHPKKELREVLEYAAELNWTIEPKQGRSGHAWGRIKCPHGCCLYSINSTPRNPTTDARRIYRKIHQCTEGKTS